MYRAQKRVISLKPEKKMRILTCISNSVSRNQCYTYPYQKKSFSSHIRADEIQEQAGGYKLCVMQQPLRNMNR